MDKIDKQVRLLHKSLRGEITVPGVIKYLERYGYNTVFFNTQKGDKLLQAMGTDKEDAEDSAAFSLCGTAKLVFVDDALHCSDKLYSLLHECGHVVLGHIGYNQIRMQDERRTENEAEAFAYAALHYKSRSFSRKIHNALSAAWDSVISFFIRAGEQKTHTDETGSGSTEELPGKG